MSEHLNGKLEFGLSVLQPLNWLSPFVLVSSKPFNLLILLRILYSYFLVSELEVGVMYNGANISISKSWSGLRRPQHLPSLCLQDHLLWEVEPSRG